MSSPPGSIMFFVAAILASLEGGETWLIWTLFGLGAAIWILAAIAKAAADQAAK